MSLRQHLLEMYWRCERTIVPGLGSAHCAYYAELRKALESRPVRWLDLGCGRELVYRWLPPRDAELTARALCHAGQKVGLDADFSSLRDNTQIRDKVFGNMQAGLPFAGGAFDLITANMVAEHLTAPAACFREIARILRPGGLALIHTPNLRSPGISFSAMMPDAVKRMLVRIMEADREDADVFPAYYRVNTPSAVSKAAEGAGLSITDLQLVWTTAATSSLGILAIPELLTIRVLNALSIRSVRPNMIATLRHQGA
jgi:SAM-dependent methyltransferase